MPGGRNTSMTTYRYCSTPVPLLLAPGTTLPRFAFRELTQLCSSSPVAAAAVAYMPSYNKYVLTSSHTTSLLFGQVFYNC